MGWEQVVQRVDAASAQAFVRAARRVIDAMLIEAEEVRATQTPTRIDYRTAELSRAAPSGGWISTGELKRTSQLMSEAIATERWTDGVIAAVRLFRMMGG